MDQLEIKMEKFLNFPTVILSLFIIRPMILGASIADALVIIGLSALYGFYYYNESKKEPIANKALVDRIVELEEQSRITKESVHSLKLGVGLKR